MKLFIYKKFILFSFKNKMDYKYFLTYYDHDKKLKNYKEFDDELELTETVAESSNNVNFLKHQWIVSRILSPYSGIDSLLLLHDMGTGKTCTSILSFYNNVYCENPSLSFKLNYAKCFVIVKNKTLKYNFINEIRKYYLGFNENTKLKDIKKIFNFYTFEIFAKKIVNRDLPKYENSFFIVDEAHNLKKKKKDSALLDTYDIIKNFFQSLNNCKILLLSGTPMKDNPMEIASLLNLILKKQDEFDVDKFNTTYFQCKDGKNEDKYTGKILMNDFGEFINKEDFKRRIKNKISFLKNMPNNIKKEYQGSYIAGLKLFKVYTSVMGEFQEKIYYNSYQEDKENMGIYNNSKQSSLFVFPDKSYGMVGYEKYKNSLDKYIYSENKTEQFANLFKYSSKYHSLLKILESQVAEKSFIYCDLVNGSGVITLSKILKIFGYKEIMTNTKSATYKNFCVLTKNENLSDIRIKELISNFNDKSNSDGRYISFIIGSRIVSEGISLNNIKNIHIITPHWNYAETSQAIMRGIRFGSHDSSCTLVKIYHHVNLTRTNIENSIDYIVLKISEIKEKAISQVKKCLKESAIDCEIFKNRNMLTPAYDFTTECEYKKCEFTCDSELISSENNNPDFEINYNLLYNEEENKIIVNLIKDFFYKNIYLMITIQDLYEKICQKKKSSMFNFLNCLFFMETNNIFINNDIHGKLFIRIFREIVFLNSFIDKTFLLEHYYLKHFSLEQNINMITDEFIENKEIYTLSKVIKYINSDQSEKAKDLIINTFKQETIFSIIKNCVSSILAENHKVFYIENKKFVNFITTLFSDNFKIINKEDIDKVPKISEVYALVWFHTINEYLPKFKKIEKYNFFECWLSWDKNKNLDSVFRSFKSTKFDKNKMINNLYGLYNPDNGFFCLKMFDPNLEKDKRKISSGKGCLYWKKNELITFAVSNLKLKTKILNKYKNANDDDLQVIIDANKNARDLFEDVFGRDKKNNKILLSWFSKKISVLCKEIQSHFEKENMIVEDFNCGHQHKKK